MEARLAYCLHAAFQRAVASLRGNPQDWAACRSLAIYHASTAFHLRAFLEGFFSDHPACSVSVYSHEAIEKLRAEDSRFGYLVENCPLRFENVPGESAADCLILLHSPRVPRTWDRVRAVRRAFRRRSCPKKLIINGDGSVWRGSMTARLARRFVDPAARRAHRAWASACSRQLEQNLDWNADRESHIVATLQERDSDVVTLVRTPTRICRDMRTGLIYKPDFIASPPSEDMYEYGYHDGEYLDEAKDWAALLNDYQAKRWRYLRSALPEYANGARRATVLDVGCGTGGLVDKLGREGFQAAGIDVSQRAVALAKRFHPGHEFQSCTLESFVWKNPERTFDLVTMSHSLEHMRDDAAILRQCGRLMRDDSRLYIEVPLASREALPMRAHWFEQSDHFREYSFAALEEVLDRAGFDVIHHGSAMDFPDPEPYQFVSARLRVLTLA